MTKKSEFDFDQTKDIKEELFEVILPKLDERLSTNKDYGLLLNSLFYVYLMTI